MVVMREPVEPPAGQPFDRLADDYDARFTDSRLGRRLRRKVQRHLAEAFTPGQHLLELGCGTGEDAVWLAERQITVTAVDASAAMLGRAREKAARRGVEGRISFRRVDLNRPGNGALAAEPDSPPFDGALSDFGALNCLSDRAPLLAELAQRIRPGGHLVLVVMGPFCLLEFAGHLLRGRPRAATRRFRPAARARLDEQASVAVHYPSPRRLRRELAPWFRHRKSVGIGLLLPPTDFARFVERRPRLFAAADALDDRLTALLPSSWLSDHYLMILERR